MNRIMLPEEIILEVTTYLSQPDLATFIRASKQSHRIGRPVLYRLNIEDKLYIFDWASDKNKVQVMQDLTADILKANEADPSIGFRALASASRGGHYDIVRYFLAQGISPNLRSGQVSPLAGATRHDHVEVVSMLLYAGADLDTLTLYPNPTADQWPDAGRENILHCAAMHGSTRILEMLPYHDLTLDINARDQHRRTAVSRAAEAGHAETVHSLIAQQADISVPDRMGRTCLHHAVLSGDSRTVTVLLDAGADPNAADRMGRTPLFSAAMNGAHDIIAVLLKRGADIQASDLMGRTALALAAELGRGRTLELLICYGANANSVLC